MLQENPINGWLAEVAADAVVVQPDDPTFEARSNQRAFSLTPEQLAVITAVDLAKFIDAAVAVRAQWLAKRRLGPMRFYCWHDVRSHQLRFSLVSGGGIRSLFDTPIDLVTIPRAVANDFLKRDDSNDRPSVWVTTIP